MIAETVRDIRLDRIRVDAGTQARDGISFEAVKDYAEEMQDGAKFPPVAVFDVGDAHFLLVDGFHRVEAANLLQWRTISAEVRQGTIQEAKIYAAGANRGHGLRRTHQDKRATVDMLLRDETLAKKSDRELGELAGVDHKTVGVIRDKLVSGGEIPHLTEVQGADGKTYPANRPKGRLTGKTFDHPADPEPAEDGHKSPSPPFNLTPATAEAMLRQAAPEIFKALDTGDTQRAEELAGLAPSTEGLFEENAPPAPPIEEEESEPDAETRARLAARRIEQAREVEQKMVSAPVGERVNRAYLSLKGLIEAKVTPAEFRRHLSTTWLVHVREWAPAIHALLNEIEREDK